MSYKGTDHYFETTQEHQDETINSLNKEVEAVDKEIQKLLDQRDIITNCMVKFQTEALMALTKWKIDEKN